MSADKVCDIFRVMNICLAFVILYLMRRDAKRNAETWSKQGIVKFYFFFALVANQAYGLIEKIHQDAPPASAVYVGFVIFCGGVIGFSRNNHVQL